MCGIIGYVGTKQATPILLEGLKNLEYRGYDSSGVGVVSLDAPKVLVRKAQGKIKELETLLDKQPVKQAALGISHTRWATHGAPSKKNAHPHTNALGTLSVVHNGIIENYELLKSSLIKQGYTFTSDTDTEVIVHLLDSVYEGDLVRAVKKVIRQLKGAFALGIISSKHPDMLIAARVGSPLIIGIGKNEHFIASDVPAILNRTRRVVYLKDGEMAVMSKDTLQLMTFDGKPVKPKVDEVTFSVEAAQKQGYPHFMLKEIHEQPDVLQQMFDARIKKTRVSLEGIGLTDAQLKSIKRIKVVACGTAYHAGLVGRYAIEELARIPVDVDVSSEFRYRNPLVDSKTLTIAISQSGETADTLAAIREAKARGSKVIAICNVIGSSLAREADGVLYTHAGPEIGVASTKAYTAQLAMLYLLALKMGRVHKQISTQEWNDFIKELKAIPKVYQSVLKKKGSIAKVAKQNSHFGCFLFLGRNINFPSALEGALKLKEISYIPAEGYAAGEMKHGPIALIDEYRAVVCVTTQSDTYEKMVSNIQEILSRKGKIITIATEGDKGIKKHAHYVIYVPKTHALLTPLVVALPLQFIAYYIAVNRDCDVDQPRNLAKSVTVE